MDFQGDDLWVATAKGRSYGIRRKSNMTLPILNKYVVNSENLPQPTHDAAWWEAKTKGFDFSLEDRFDPDNLPIASARMAANSESLLEMFPVQLGRAFGRVLFCWCAVTEAT